MLSYPAIPLTTRTLNHLAGLIRRHREQRRTRWRRLDPARQALLALAHLRNGDTYTRLAWGFEIGVSTAWRYVREAVDMLAATADDLTTANGRDPRRDRRHRTRFVVRSRTATNSTRNLRIRGLRLGFDGRSA